MRGNGSTNKPNRLVVDSLAVPCQYMRLFCFDHAGTSFFDCIYIQTYPAPFVEATLLMFSDDTANITYVNDPSENFGDRHWHARLGYIRARVGNTRPKEFHACTTLLVLLRVRSASLGTAARLSVKRQYVDMLKMPPARRSTL